MVPGHDGLEARQPRRQPDIFRGPWQEKRPQAELLVWRFVGQAFHQIDETQLFVQRHPWSPITNREEVDEAKLSVQRDPAGEARIQLPEAELTFRNLQQEIDQAERSVWAPSSTRR